MATASAVQRQVCSAMPGAAARSASAWHTNAGQQARWCQQPTVVPFTGPAPVVLPQAAVAGGALSAARVHRHDPAHAVACSGDHLQQANRAQVDEGA